MAFDQKADTQVARGDEEAMKKVKNCSKCGSEMYRDDQNEWFCPDCVLEEINPAFLDQRLDHPGELSRAYVLEPPTKQVSIRLAVGDVELARKLARRKRVPKYQTYIKELLHEALIKEAASGQ
jgi:predicted DNA binding CopG/RHH family protein